MSSPEPRTAFIAAYLWIVGTALLALLGPPVPWSASALALLLASISALARDERLAALALALGVAPLWTAAASGAGGLALVVALGSGAILMDARGGPLAPLPWILAGLGLILAGRQIAAAQALPAALATAGPLVLAGLALAGAAAGARRSAAKILCLLGVGLFGAVQAGRAALHAPRDVGEVARDEALGVLALHSAALTRTPNLGLEALRLDPELHTLALGLWPETGADALLDAGWRPEGADLSAEQRLDLAARLDGRGEGGRAIRVLRPGRSDAQVAWRLELLRRCQGLPGDFGGTAPGGTPTLPGAVPLGWAFLQNGTATLDFQAEGPLEGLRLELRGTPYQGPVVLSVRLDGGAALKIEAPEHPGWLPVAGPLANGPHRLTVRFEGDLVGPGGDRNAWVLAVASP